MPLKRSLLRLLFQKNLSKTLSTPAQPLSPPKSPLNTLDTHQVRDNGAGIAPEDRDLVCRPHCTSKIPRVDDLRRVGGNSLGFRGEALASIAELAGGLSITTRVEGEATATCLKIDAKGEVVGRERASHPVGTMVRVECLFKGLPVRKQTALKGASKCLAKTKRMLQSYALARPTVRFSLKVLKAKNEKDNWMYAPKTGAEPSDAAFKVVGKDCAIQCELKVMKHEGFEIRAFLLKHDADPVKICGLGHFVSVDARPVTTQRGTMNQLIKIFKERLKQSDSKFRDVKDPFIWINMTCSPESYDANVEPAMDDVVFQDPDIVLQAMRCLLDDYYPETNAGSPPCPQF